MPTAGTRGLGRFLSGSGRALRLPAALRAALLLLTAAGLAAGSAWGAEERAEDSFAGRLLVASGNMGDPRFQETVIYMVEHSAEGAMGLVVNVPMGEVPFSDIFESMGIDLEAADGSLSVHYGGPVEPGRGFMLHSADVVLEGSKLVDETVALTTQTEILRAIAQGEGPEHSLFALGYAGWGPGQLESELARDAWFVIPAEPSLVFAEDPSESWKRAVALRGIDL
ncbi:MAG: YqgE/AlgH family protein [Kiloniellaceae bacterium]